MASSQNEKRKKLFKYIYNSLIVASVHYKMDSDGKTISYYSATKVLKILGNDINNASGNTIAKMSIVTIAIRGAKSQSVRDALWWVMAKGGNK